MLAGRGAAEAIWRSVFETGMSAISARNEKLGNDP
jgi:hypothetical protein